MYMYMYTPGVCASSSFYFSHLLTFTRIAPAKQLPVSQCQGNCGGEILQAMMDIADPTKHPEFKGTVGFVDSHPLEHSPGSSGGHYGHDALTYMNVGEAMGAAMVKLLDSRK